MSKAFTREENEGPELPELAPLRSALPEGAKNYMTEAGAERLRSELQKLVEQERPRLLDDDPESKRLLAKLDARIFQIEQSLQSAAVVSLPSSIPETVTFGATVTVRDDNREETTYRIVGVDEADFEQGEVSWLSPIARALTNAKRGERVRFRFPSGEQELEIIAIRYQ